MAASRNQLNLVVLKLQLLEDELGKLYEGVERYCNDIINKGAESISRRGTRDGAINEFLVAYEHTLRFIKEKIKQMEKYTRVPRITQRVSKTGPSETPMFKVITNLETLRDLKRQFHQMITNLLSEMMSMGKRFIKNQDPKRLNHDEQKSYKDRTTSGLYADRLDSDTFMESSIPRRASLDVRSSRDKQVPVFDSRRGSLDLRSSRDGRRTGFDAQKDVPLRFKSAFQPLYPRLETQQEIQIPKAQVKDDLNRAGQDGQISLLDLPRLGFAEVNRHLESCLLFVMDIRLEFGEHEEFNIEDVLSMLHGGGVKQMLTSTSNSSPAASSQQSQSLENLEKRIGALEAIARAKTSEEELVPKTLPPADTERLNIPSQNCEGCDLKVRQLEERHRVLAKDYDDNMPLVKNSIAMIVQEIEELNERFDSFKRIFAASKSESQRMLTTIGRRMSDVECKDSSKRLSCGEGAEKGVGQGRRLSTPEGSTSDNGSGVARAEVTLSYNGDDVFEEEIKSHANGVGKGETDVTLSVKSGEESVTRDSRSLLDVEERLLARLREETKKDLSGAVEHIQEIDAKLNALQELQKELVEKISSSSVLKEPFTDNNKNMNN
ncbi:unnamed protein product [Lymnaea stagnalis]|uniref:Uncharacterized protein n=1 Tax=Lymnaea stagnalis TaxID=6523 RepID=A0AAV2H7B8_LYMST